MDVVEATLLSSVHGASARDGLIWARGTASEVEMVDVAEPIVKDTNNKNVFFKNKKVV